MERTDFAYFVEGPRIIEDLKVPHPIEQEMQYEIVKTAKLAKIDYENFITDMIILISGYWTLDYEQITNIERFPGSLIKSHYFRHLL